MSKKIFIQFMDDFHQWKQYTMKHNQRDAYRTAVNRSKSTGRRMRLVDEDGTLLDLIEP